MKFHDWSKLSNLAGFSYKKNVSMAFYHDLKCDCSNRVTVLARPPLGGDLLLFFFSFTA